MRATASFTSLTARSVGTSKLNSMAVVDAPSMIVDMMCFTPVIEAIASSTFLVTWLRSSEGAAPDWVTVTATTGTSMFGNRVTGMPRNATMPSAISTTNSTSAGMGWRIDQAEKLKFMDCSP